MNRLTPPRPFLALTALAFLLGSASACGGSKVDPGTGALGSTVDPTPTTTAATTPTPTAPVSTAATPKPSKTVATEGDGDAEGDDQPSTKGGGICRYVGAEEVGAVLGVALRGAAVPGETGCKFDQAGNRGMSVTILDRPASEGMDGAKSEATSAVEGTPQDLSGIGSAAFVVTGGMFGGPDVNAAGAVRIGRRIISVFLVQGSHLAEAKVRRFEVDLLKLVATEAP